MRLSLLIRSVLAVLALVAFGEGAFAQYRDRQHYREERGGRDTWDEPSQKNVAGEFDYYALVLSWSPSYCAEAGSDDDTQCNRRDGRRFNFVLHGLWPQYDRGWPQDCRTARRPFVPQPLIDSMLDIMPSSRLVIHEYRKHGTCSGLSADGYFNLARRLFKSIRIPETYQNPFEAQTIEPRQLAADLIRANPGLKPDNFAISCGGAGNRLKEVRFCFSKSGEPAACGKNEDQRKLCSATRMFVPPVRSTARDNGDAPATRFDRAPQRSNPLPAPRMDDYERGRGI
jgi:ribonuclease T2